MSRPRVKVVVSIDTEEDNWTPTREDIRVGNIEALPGIQSFLTGLGLRPTYFVDYPVASTDWSAAILRTLHESGQAEVAAHLHPWNTPPFDEPFSAENTMMKNLPAPLQAAKLRTLRQVLGEAVGRRPTSFRAGRFGLGPESVQALIDQGFLVDSSVTPFVSWREHANGGDFSEAPAGCYRIDGHGPVHRPVPYGALCEVPLSCGFTRHPFAWRNAVYQRLASPRLRRLKLAGLAARTGLVRRVIGSPETNSVADLLALAQALVRAGVGMVHLFFHSPSLVPGLSPFVQSESDLRRLHDTLEQFVEGVRGFAEVEAATVDEAAQALCT
jgi:hypothetical protein